MAEQEHKQGGNTTEEEGADREMTQRDDGENQENGEIRRESCRAEHQNTRANTGGDIERDGQTETEMKWEASNSGDFESRTDGRTDTAGNGKRQRRETADRR